MRREEAYKRLEHELELSDYDIYDTDEAIMDAKNYDEALKVALQALKQTQWIPISEKPRKNGAYLCSARFNDNYIGICIADYADDLYKVDNFDFHDKKGISGWYDYDSEYGYYEMESVIAWMPLPKQYEPQERSEDEKRMEKGQSSNS